MKLADLYRRADLGIRLGALDDATRLARAVLAEFPDDLQARLLLGHALLERGDLDQARQQFQRVLELDPENATALSALGVALSAGGQLDGAVAAFERAYDLAPSNGAVRESLLRLYAQRDTPAALPMVPALAIARWRMNHEPPAAVLLHLDRLQRCRPDDPCVQLLRIELLWRAGRADDALAACTRLIEAAPDLLKPRLIRAEILAGRPDCLEEGVALLHEALARDPGGSVARRLFGDAADRLAPVDAAGPTFRPPVLRDRLDVVLPPDLIEAPNDVEAAFGLLSRDDAAADAAWIPSDEVLEADARALAFGPRAPALSDDTDEEETSPAAGLIDGAKTPSNDMIGGQAGVPMRVPGACVLIVSCRAAIEARHGFDGFQRVDRRIQALRAELGGFGIALRCAYVDDTPSMAGYGLRPIGGGDPDSARPGETVTPEAVRAAIRDLEAVLEAAREPVGAIILLGGDGVVPFFRLPNPADDDDDAVVTDNPYACRDDDFLLPDVPCGRLPDGEAGHLGLLMRQLDGLLENRKHRLAAPASNGLAGTGRAALEAFGVHRAGPSSFGCAAPPWRQSATTVFRAIGAARALRLSPPTVGNSFDGRWLNGRDFLYFSLHGGRGTAAWFGQKDADAAADGPTFPLALTPEMLAAAQLESPVVFAEVCHAADVLGKTPTNALALRFLLEGAAAFVGPTDTCYGSLQPPLAGADLLGGFFWEAMRAGEAAGAALVEARARYVDEMVARQGYLDGDDQKTLLQFVVLGDPLATLCAADGTARVDAVEVPPRRKVLCKHHARDRSATALTPELLQIVLDHLAMHYPVLGDGGIRVHRRPFCAGGCGMPGHARSIDRDRGAVPTITTVTARKRLPAETGHLTKVARLTLDGHGAIFKTLVSR